jgi:hypothetical protein
MQIVCLLWGLLASFGMMIAMIPFLGILNWLNIPFAFLGLLISSVTLGVSNGKPCRGSAAGMALCTTAIGLGMVRLYLGCGLL